jgi:hypothetical protein
VATEGISYITDSNGNLKVFNVEHNDNGQWLNSNNGNPDNVWNAENRWVFRRNYLYFSRKAREFYLLVQTSNPTAKHLADLL